jgi:hypothetical protein
MSDPTNYRVSKVITQSQTNMPHRRRANGSGRYRHKPLGYPRLGCLSHMRAPSHFWIRPTSTHPFFVSSSASGCRLQASGFRLQVQGATVRDGGLPTSLYQVLLVLGCRPAG